MKNKKFLFLISILFLYGMSYADKALTPQAVAHICREKLSVPVENVTPLTGGLSGSQVFAVETAAKKYVLKYVNGGGFAKELERALFASREGFGPRIFYYDVAGQWYLMDYLVRERIVPGQRSQETLYRALAQLLKKIHTSPQGPLRSWSIYDSFARVFESLRNKNTGMPATTEIHKEIRRYIDKVQQELVLDRTVPVFNDLNPGNVISTEGGLYTIDPMDMSLGDPFVDLAYASLFWCFDEQSEQMLMHHYFSRIPTQQEYAKLATVKKLVLLLIALHMENIAPAESSFVYNNTTTDTMHELVKAYVDGTFFIKNADDMMRVASLFVCEALGKK